MQPAVCGSAGYWLQLEVGYDGAAPGRTGACPLDVCSVRPRPLSLLPSSGRRQIVFSVCCRQRSVAAHRDSSFRMRACPNVQNQKVVPTTIELLKVCHSA